MYGLGVSGGLTVAQNYTVICGFFSFSILRKIAGVTRADRRRMVELRELRDRGVEEFDRETGEEQTTVGRTRREDGRRQTTEESGRVK